MRLAIEQAGLDPAEIDVVCASACGVASLDRHEASAIRTVFENRAGTPRISVPKSLLGEPLGAAGPLQCIAMIQAMQSGLVPAEVELGKFPEEAAQHLQPTELPEHNVRTCLINSLSYDGHCCSLVITSSSQQVLTVKHSCSGELR
jgi:3-oxoacyl-[acyl-carrier-protein] synthase II